MKTDIGNIQPLRTLIAEYFKDLRFEDSKDFNFKDFQDRRLKDSKIESDQVKDFDASYVRIFRAENFKDQEFCGLKTLRSENGSH